MSKPYTPEEFDALPWLRGEETEGLRLLHADEARLRATVEALAAEREALRSQVGRLRQLVFEMRYCNLTGDFDELNERAGIEIENADALLMGRIDGVK